MMARRVHGLSKGSANLTSTALCIVRVEHQGPADFLVTVTRTPDITAAPNRVTTRRTVEIEVAVEEVRSLLNEFRGDPAPLSP